MRPRRNLQPRVTIALLASSLGVLSCVKTPRVEHLKLRQDSSGFEDWHGEGLVYALPRTVFDATFSVEQVKLEAPQCYAQYEDEDARKDAWRKVEVEAALIEPAPRTLYSLTGSSLNAVTVPDPEAVFISRLSSNKATLNINLGAHGIVGGFQGQSESQAIAVVAKSIEVAAGIGSELLLAGAASAEAVDPAGCDRLVEQYGALRRELSELRASNVPLPRDTVEAFQKEIRAEMAAIQAVFLGRPTVTRAAVVCRLNPTKAGPSEVLSVHRTEGLTAAHGVPCHIPADFTSEADRFREGTMLSLEVALADTTIQNAYDARDAQDSSDAGFFYREPASAYISLSGHPNAELKPVLFEVPQLGQVRSLPRLRGSKPSLTVELYPESGALKKVVTGRTRADVPGLIDSTSAGANAVLDAIKERRQATRPGTEARDDTPLDAFAQGPGPSEAGRSEAELAIEKAKRALRER